MKTMEKMMAFASGLGIGLMFKKYEKEITKYMKEAYKNMND